MRPQHLHIARKDFFKEKSSCFLAFCDGDDAEHFCGLLHGVQYNGYTLECQWAKDTPHVCLSRDRSPRSLVHLGIWLPVGTICARGNRDESSGETTSAFLTEASKHAIPVSQHGVNWAPAVILSAAENDKESVVLAKTNQIWFSQCPSISQLLRGSIQRLYGPGKLDHWE